MHLCSANFFAFAVFQNVDEAFYCGGVGQGYDASNCFNSDPGTWVVRASRNLLRAVSKRLMEAIWVAI